MADSSFFSRAKEFLERVLALKVTEEERLRYASHGIFEDGEASRRPLQVAAELAALFHILLFLIVFPHFGKQIFIPTEQVLIVKNLAEPAGGGGSLPKAAPPEPVKPAAKPVVMPIPDPTPDQPEPIRKEEIQEPPQIMNEIAANFEIGDIEAPPGPPGRGEGGGSGTVGRGTGPGPGTQGGPGGDALYSLGTQGITDPVILVKTTPAYTDDAIKAKVQGVILLQGIIRKNGQVDTLTVLRGLGHGLEERAIREIASSWRFRPGTKDGKPVDVLATIEVTFNLR